MPNLSKAKKRSVILHALASYCKKQAEREELKGGDAFDVDIAIEGTIGKQKISEQCRGSLTVGHDGTKNSSYGIAPAKLIGWLLAKDPNAAKHIEQLRELAKSKKLGENVTADQEEKGAKLLALFNQSESKTTKGSVSFSLAKPAK